MGVTTKVLVSENGGGRGGGSRKRVTVVGGFPEPRNEGRKDGGHPGEGRSRGSSPLGPRSSLGICHF